MSGWTQSFPRTWVTPRCAGASIPRRSATLGISAPLQEPSAFENRRHCLFDSRRPCCRLLGRGEVVQITSLAPWRQRLERALEARVHPESLAQLLGNRKLRGLLLRHPQASLLDRDGLAHVGPDGRRLRPDV